MIQGSVEVESVGWQLTRMAPLNPQDSHPSIYSHPTTHVQLIEEDGSDQEQEANQSELYSDHPVHAHGVPRCEVKLLARKYRHHDFADTVFKMLKIDLGLVGWSELSEEMKPLISIYKVSGSLTNAVFFVSCPTSTNDHRLGQHLTNQLEPPPTVLLRIYGPSSGSLISRKRELHLLHTLSAQYGIGPLLLGTFYNGRVEQYFKSRPLTKDELRHPRISRWIARKMRELHSVDIASVTGANGDELPSSHSRNGSLTNSLRPSIRPSTNSTSSWSSSVCTSATDLSSSSVGTENPSNPSSCLHLGSLSSSMSVIRSPEQQQALASKCSLESLNSLTLTTTTHKIHKFKPGAWHNITRWQHEATKVLNEVIKLSESLDLGPITLDELSTASDPLETFRSSPVALSSPKALVTYFKNVDLPRLIVEMKAYKTWVQTYEKLHGKSSIVFSHNDTQCGNLLLRESDQTNTLDNRPHDQILVIDFEYASPNPRGFDIANHFHEWCADYHHPSKSYSLTSHGLYPTLNERKRFYRAYLGIDNNYDGIEEEEEEEETQKEEEGGKGKEETKEKREEKEKNENQLEEEVKRWSPISHAMWALWGIVQSRDDLKYQIERWRCQQEFNVDSLGHENEMIEFDYLSYSMERIILFRKQLIDLNIS